MVLLAQIEKVVRSQMKDKITGNSSEMFQLVLSDKTKPAQFRTSTFFTTYMGEEKFRGLFGPADPTDERVTVAVSEMAPQNNLMKVKGQVLVGWLSFEQLAQLQFPAEAPAAPPAPAPGKPAASAK